MHASTIFALAAATLASAAPVNQARAEDCDTGSIAVSKFVYGCTGCNYSFDAAIQCSLVDHPAVPGPIHCEGGWTLDASDRPSDYVLCDYISASQTLGAFIDRDSNVLSIRYTTTDFSTGAIYRYTGNETVYAVTSNNADLQQSEFVVKEQTATGVL